MHDVRSLLTVPIRRLQLLALVSLAALCTAASAHDLGSRIVPRPWLSMPAHAGDTLPPLLSQTGVFVDTARMVPANTLIPYDLIVSFWSDGAAKRRWIALPRGKIGYSASGEWSFPSGTVFIKTFELPLDAARPEITRRLETRLLVRDADGGVYGAVYKWRADNSDAELLNASLSEPIEIRDASGQTHMQVWYYPSRQECLACHTAGAGGVLGVKTRQLNRNYVYPSGTTDNELRVWNRLGLFQPRLQEAALANLMTLASPDDVHRSLEDRARSYLDANCSQCHRPGGTVAYFDARYSTPLDRQQLVDAPVLIDQGIDRPKVISPHDVWRSIAYMRINTNDDIRMPPLARETIDRGGVELLGEWIRSLPGRDVVDPPTITPAGGSFAAPIEVSLANSDPTAEMHYTLDGSVPGSTDPRYEGPIRLAAPAVIRARAFKPGATRSITVQQAFIVGSP